VLALEQAWQQRQGAAARVPGMAFVCLPLLLNRCEHRGLHERRDRDRAPVLRCDITGGDGTPGLERTMALGAPPGPHRLQTGLTNRRDSLVGGIVQDAPYHTPLPPGLARARHLAGLGQPTADLANGQAVVADPGTALAHHAGFVRDELRAGLPTALVLGPRALPLGGPAAHIARPALGRMALAPPMPLAALGPFILGHHPLPLPQQIVCRTLPQGPVEAQALDTRAADLIDQQDVIGICAGQASRRVDLEPGDAPRRAHIAQALQRRAHQSGSTRAFVQQLHRLGYGQPISRHALAPGGHLPGNGMGLGLLLRRYPCVYRHLSGIQACCLLPTGCVCDAPSACGGARACGVGRRVIGTTRSYACPPQAGLTRLGSNVMRTARVRLRPCPRRATLTSLGPWRGAFARWHSLEWSPQKPLTIPGAQLGSRNTC